MPYICDVMLPVAGTLASSRRVRRTQDERRAATRAALLDATIDCLAEEGYAQTTTRRVAERAAVTPGALQHHFDTKIEMLGQARQHLGSKLVRGVLADPPTDVSPLALRNEVMLDRWWRLCAGPGFQAIVELLVAARTDKELRVRLRAAERDNAHLYVTGARAIFPELVDQPGFQELMATGLATLRGLAMLRFISDVGAEQAWPATRTHLSALFTQFCDAAGVA